MTSPRPSLSIGISITPSIYRCFFNFEIEKSQLWRHARTNLRSSTDNHNLRFISGDISKGPNLRFECKSHTPRTGKYWESDNRKHHIEGEGLGLVTQNILSVSLNTPLTPHPNFRAVWTCYVAISHYPDTHTDTLIACELAIQLASWSDQNIARRRLMCVCVSVCLSG